MLDYRHLWLNIVYIQGIASRAHIVSYRIHPLPIPAHRLSSRYGFLSVWRVCACVYCCSKVAWSPAHTPTSHSAHSTGGHAYRLFDGKHHASIPVRPMPADARGETNCMTSGFAPPPQIATNTSVYREYTLEITDGNLHFAPYLLEHHPLPRLGLPWIFTVVFRSPRSILWDRDRPWCHRLPRYVAGHFAALDYTH